MAHQSQEKPNNAIFKVSDRKNGTKNKLFHFELKHVATT
jgi:hypothetical protein